MEHKSFEGMSCPIALALDHVGEWWSILILRDATHGITRFDQFQKSLGISTNSLSRRLGKLVDAGLLERRRYNDRPPRDEYLLTEAGEAFRPILIALYAWGIQYFPPEAPNVRLVDRESGLDVDPIMIDRATGHPLDEEHSMLIAGPAADDRLRRILEQQNDGIAS
jgi:DNA-binding HxlR family transcriptional regulator